MKTLISLLFLFILVGCKQKDPNPELSDAIYKDLVQELDIMKKALEGKEKEYQTTLKDLREVVPQTGQIKMAEKKVFEAQNMVEKFRQQKLFFEIKLEQRKNYVKDRYEESLRTNGRAWPDPQEVKEYQAKLEFQKAKIEWEKNKGIVKDVPRGTK